MFERRLFGKTDYEILRALEFYDKYSEQAVQDDLIFSEAVEKVYAIQKEYAGYSGIDKKWVEVQLKSYEAIGLIKFKKKPNQTSDLEYISSVLKGDTLKTVYVNHALINHIGDKLREKCRAIFGTSWSNDIARVFARIAITEYELQKAKDE